MLSVATTAMASARMTRSTSTSSTSTLIFARSGVEHEYVRYGALALLAPLGVHTGGVHTGDVFADTPRNHPS